MCIPIHRPVCLFFLFLFSAQSVLHGQSVAADLLPDKGLASVRYMGRSDFKSNDQFHTMIEDDQGFLLFGNNDGVLVWDGEHWDQIKLPNYSVVLGLAKDHRGQIWAAGFNEVGVLTKDAYGKYCYESRTEVLGLQNSGLENIWNMVALGESLVLQYDHDIVLVKDQAATRIKARNYILYSGVIGDKFLIQDMSHGVYQLDAETRELVLLFREDQIANEKIRVVFPGQTTDYFYLITAAGGFYEVGSADGSVRRLFQVFSTAEEDEVNTGIATGNGGYILGTQGSKLIEILPDRSVNRDYYLNRRIRSSTVEDLYSDSYGNLWVLLNKGLNYINYKAGSVQLLEEVPVFDVLIDGDQMYVASNQGVFKMPVDPARSQEATKIDDLAGQVWSLSKIGEDVLIGHEDGLFRLEGGRVESLRQDNGFWGVCAIPGRDDIYLGTTYRGFYLISKEGDAIDVGNRIEGFDESTRDIVPALDDPFTFWVCHGYKGVYRVKFNKDYTKVVSTEFFTTFNGLESPYTILAREFDGRIIFTSNTGMYTFDDKAHRFVPEKGLNQIFDPSKNTTFLEKAYGKVWFVTDGVLGYYSLDDPDSQLVTLPFEDLKYTLIKTMESVVPLSDHRVLIGNNNGLYLYDLSSGGDRGGALHSTVISGVKWSKGDSSASFPVDGASVSEVSNGDDLQLNFQFANPLLALDGKVYYSYKLEGYDRDWSDWSEQPLRSYSRLSGGDYVFKVRSKGANGVDGGVVHYAFRVTPAWYETTLWHVLLAFLASFTVLMVAYLVGRKIRIERVAAHKKLMQSERMLRLEMEKYKLTVHQDQVEREKRFLEDDVVEKSKELANYTLLLSKRKQLFMELYNDLRELRRQVKKEENKRVLSSVFKKLDGARIDEKYLEIFDVHFERVHHDFISRLKELNIHLTRREEQLCALIKMDLSNKEIAPILNLSLRGVESARYRLRKKLDLHGADTLKEYLDNFDTAAATKSEAVS